MRVLVTGGLGFIGSYVCRNLRDRGITPVVLDRKAGADVFGDIRDASAVSEAVYETDGCIHVAGVLGTQETVQHPLAAVETNVLGGLNVFTALRDYGKPGVYICVGNHWMQNPYSISKTTAERFALMANAEWGTRIAVVRALNAYGPGQKVAPVRKIMPTFITTALRGDPIVVYGDGEQVMDMIHVADVAEILVRGLLVGHGVYDRVFEAGTGRRTTVNDIAEAVIAEVGSGSIEHVPMRPGEPEGSVVLGNPDTLHPLGPIELTTLEDGLKETVAYYRGLG